MNRLKFLTAALLIGAITAMPATARNANAKPGNCAILAEMAAKTVKKDKRFKGHKDIAPALTKFSEAQNAKMQAGMEDTYAQSAAFGWDKAKVDKMIKDQQKAMRAGFFTSTMEKKIYMEHVISIHTCAQAQTSADDLGQSADVFLGVLQNMVKIIQQ